MKTWLMIRHLRNWHHTVSWLNPEYRCDDCPMRWTASPHPQPEE